MEDYLGKEIKNLLLFSLHSDASLSRLPVDGKSTGAMMKSEPE